MMQSRLASMLEVAIGTAIGFAVAMWTTAVILPKFGFPVTNQQNFEITAIFTVVSVVRSYAVRRAFNYFHRSRVPQ